MDRTTSEAVIQKAIGSVKWAALTEGISRTFPPLVFIILARLLTPADFGVAATAMIAISFSTMFWEAGLGKTLIQTQEAPEQAANVIFWLNTGLGLLSAAILFVTAPWIAAFFHSPASQPVLRVLCIHLLINSLLSVQRSLFRRNLDFRRLFWVKLTTATIPGCFSIPLALYGYGVWALVAGYLAGSFMELVLLWWMSPWCPSFNLSLQQVKKIYGFSRWVFLESLTEWVFGSGDKIIVGKLIGINALGLYQVGCSIVFPLFSLILSFVLPVLYSTLSRLQDDNVSLTEVFNKMNRLVILVSVPMGVGLFLMGPQLASALFGDKWAGLGWTISLLGLAEGLGWPVSINHELFRAIGRPDLNPKLMLLVTSYYLPINLIGALYSLDAFLITRLVTSVIAIPIHGYLCSVILKISPLYLWQNGKTIIFASLAMASTVFVANILNSYYIDSNSNILSLAAITSIAIITYFGTLWIFDRQFIYQVKMLVKRSCLR